MKAPRMSWSGTGRKEMEAEDEIGGVGSEEGLNAGEVKEGQLAGYGQ